jgi:hypothetical protein
MMKYYILSLIGISISLNACSSASNEQKSAYRESELRENQVVKPLPTVCLGLKKSVESKQAELREVINLDPKNNDNSTVIKQKENIARLNNEIMSGINEYKKTCIAPVEG